MVVEMAINITSHEELMVWLAGKPSGSLEVMAFRTALKTAVWAFDPDEWHDEGPARSWVLSTFLALTFSSQMIFNPSNIIWSPRIGSGREVLPSFGPAPLPSIASNRAVAAGDFASFCMTLDYTDLFAAGFRNGDLSLDIILDDIDELDRTKNPQRLLQQPLWKDRPVEWSESWDRARRWLSSTKDGFDIWREWYHGRIEGLPHVFKDFDGEADSAFYRWLIEQNDEWWDREPGQVNADIKAKVDELRQSAPPSDADLEQEPRALLFKGNEANQVALSGQTAAEALLSDSEGRDRHRLAREMANAALAASHRDLTQAFDVGGLLKAYLDALGDEPSEVRASNLVAFGGFLRNQIRNREASSKPPFTEDQQEALDQWRVAHNMLVGANPYLASLERKGRDTDLPETVLNRDLTKSIIEDGRENEALDKSAADALVQVADAVIADNDPDDPQNLTWMDSFRNSIRAAAAIIKANQLKTAASVASGIAAGAYQLAAWVQRHADALRQMFADEPSMLAIIDWIMRLLL